MNTAPLSTQQKALQINLDQSNYGTFAEIGAGQEVANWFFRVGGAAGTIAKTMSAYDMTISDAIYGSCPRYVSRDRLHTMLDHEFAKLQGRLAEKRGATTKFFVFADTVVARSYTRKDNCHGWLGIRFQTRPDTWPSQITIHVNLLDPENILQQEALGTIGVNLIHSALYHAADPVAVVRALLDNLSSARVEVDMIKFDGSEFAHVDNRLMALQLVQHGLTHAAMFTADGEVVQPGDFLYKKPILIERGSFRPVTNVTLDMLRCAMAQFVQEPKLAGAQSDILTVVEMTLRNLTDGDTIDHQDFLDRVDILGALGQTVLISDFFEFHRLARYLFRHTKQPIGIAMGVPTLKQLFDPHYYTDLEGGILEAFGRLFQNDLKLYIYPAQDLATGAVVTAGNLRVAAHLRHLYSYLMENHFIQSLRDYDPDCLPVFSRAILAKIKAGDPTWEAGVPAQVAQIIKARSLFGYRPAETATPVLVS